MAKDIKFQQIHLMVQEWEYFSGYSQEMTHGT